MKNRTESLKKLRISFYMNSKIYSRERFNIFLLIIIPYLLISTIGSALERLPEIDGKTLIENEGKMLGALWSAAFLTGLLGLFMIISSKNADRRLVLAGYSSFEVMLSRMLTTISIGLFVSAISFIALLFYFTPDNIPLAFLSIYLAAIIYGNIGILTGAVIGKEFEGSFFILFAFVFDAFIGSPLFAAEGEILKILPVFYATKILGDASFGGTFELIELIYVLIYILLLTIASTIAFCKTTKIE